MAKRKKSSNLNHKAVFMVVVIMLLVGSVSIGLLYTKYIAEKNYQDAISLNEENANKFDYSGTTVEQDASKTINYVSYSRLGTGFSYQFPVYSNMEVDSENSEDLPNLKYKNVMPYTYSYISFSYFNLDENIPYSGEKILSRKQINVDGYPAQMIELEENYAGDGDGDSIYSYHIYVVVDDVNQAVRYSSKRIELLPKKFVINASTGNTNDERARIEIIRRVNEIIPTLKFTQD